MKDYKIIDGSRKSVVEEDVVKYIRLGWKPLGGITVYWRYMSDHTVWYAQAMIKE